MIIEMKLFQALPIAATTHSLGFATEQQIHVFYK